VRKGQAAKLFEEDGNHKKGSRPSLEASAGNFKENLKRETNSKRETGSAKPIKHYEKFSKL
jgi:hypothetical protein